MQRILGFLSLIAMSSAIIPDGYMLEVKPTCTDGNTAATIDIFSDLDVTAVVDCKTGTSTSNVVINDLEPKGSFEINYSGTTDCVFKKVTENSTVYSVEVELYWREPGQTDDFVQNQKEVYSIVCSTGENKESESSANTVDSFPFSPEKKGANNGDELADNIELELCDVEGNPITGNVALGKKVQLKATSNGTGYGIIAVDCWAEDDNADEYAILKGGCGDGVVFETDEGFTSTDLSTTSPYFKFFKLHDAADMKFRCTFVKCDGDCGMTATDDSCANARRRKRDVDGKDGGSGAIIVTDDESSKPRLVTASTKSRSQKNEQYPAKTLLIYSSPRRRSDHRQQVQSDVKDQRIMFVMVAILSCLTAVTLMLSLYVCAKQERLRALDKLSQKA